jgi:hypothetical protein
LDAIGNEPTEKQRSRERDGLRRLLTERLLLWSYGSKETVLARLSEAHGDGKESELRCISDRKGRQFHQN